MKKHNFYAGPSILSEYTIKNTAAAVENFAGMGLSLLEISHRSKEFVAVNDEARALIKELLDVPAGYEVVRNHTELHACTSTQENNLIASRKLSSSGKSRLWHLLKIKTIHIFRKIIRLPTMRIISILRPIIRFTERKLAKIRM